MWERSLFERLFKVAGMNPCMLNVQHRMAESVACWPSSHFYHSKLHSHSRLRRLRPTISGFPWANGSGLAFVQVAGEEELVGNSVCNFHQVETTVRIIKTILSYKGIACSEISVLTPYDAQRTSLQDELESECKKGLVIETVDSAQGSENKLILLCTVRCNTTGALGFVKSDRRLNVGMTRAMNGCIIIGDMYTLCNKDPEDCWISCISHISESGSLFSDRLEQISMPRQIWNADKSLESREQSGMN